MHQYKQYVKNIRENGVFKSDRTGTGTYSVFGSQMRFNLADGFPLVTLKKTYLPAIIHELLWFLAGETNVRYLKENGVNIWDEWVKEETKEFGPSTLKEIHARIKTSPVLMEEFVTWVKPYYGTEQKPGYVADVKPMFELNDVMIEERVYWSHPDYDLLVRRWAEERGVATQSMIAGELGPVYGSQWRSWPTVPSYVLDGLEKVACLGNGDTWGNSTGNVLAQSVIKSIKSGQGATIDQISNVIHQLKTNPDSRRLIVSAWNPAEVDDMALPPCHALFQFYTAPLSSYERKKLLDIKLNSGSGRFWESDNETFEGYLAEMGIPERKLSCQLYQRKSYCALVA